MFYLERRSSAPSTPVGSSARLVLDAGSTTLQAEVKALERDRIVETLERCQGNQSEAARQLGMPRRTLVSRIKELGLTRRPAPEGDRE